MIAPGRYQARAIQGSHELTASSTGSEQIALPLEIQVNGTTEKAWTYLSLTDKALPFSIRRLRACGWTGKNILALSGLDSNEIEVEVKEQEHQGKTRTVIDIVAPREVKPLDAHAARALAERVARLAAESATAEDAPPPFEENDGDEVPF